MIDDVAEGVAKTLFKGVLRFLFQIIVEFGLFYTGEIVLFVLTLGKKKPRWDYYEREPASRFVILTELSTWIGIAFWLSMAFSINSILFSGDTQ